YGLVSDCYTGVACVAHRRTGRQCADDGERSRRAIIYERTVGKGDARNGGWCNGQRGRQHQIIIIRTAVDGSRGRLAARIRAAVIRVAYRGTRRQRAANGQRPRRAVVDEAAVGKSDARDRGRRDGQRGRQHQVIVIRASADSGHGRLTARIRATVIRVAYRGTRRQRAANGQRPRRAVIDEAAVGKSDARNGGRRGGQGG